MESRRLSNISNFISKESNMYIIKNYFLAYKYAGDFQGTSDHKEFWPFIIINFLITIWYLNFSYNNLFAYDVYTGHLLWFYLTISIPTVTLTIRYLRKLNLPTALAVILIVPLGSLIYICTNYIPSLRSEVLFDFLSK